MRLNNLFIAALLLSIPTLSYAGEPSSQMAFKQLKGLVGNWKPTDSKDQTLIEIKLIANGSALIETWTMSPTRQSMTIYALDGDRLLVTHYCPQGNAPRLAFTETDSSGAHHFQFVDGTNLQNTEASHEHALWIRQESDGTLTRSETYIVNGSTYDPTKNTGEIRNFLRAK